MSGSIEVSHGLGLYRINFPLKESGIAGIQLSEEKARELRDKLTAVLPIR